MSVYPYPTSIRRPIWQCNWAALFNCRKTSVRCCRPRTAVVSNINIIVLNAELLLFFLIVFSRSLPGGGGGDGATLPCAQLPALRARVRGHERDRANSPAHLNRCLVQTISLLNSLRWFTNHSKSMSVVAHPNLSAQHRQALYIAMAMTTATYRFVVPPTMSSIYHSNSNFCLTGTVFILESILSSILEWRIHKCIWAHAFIIPSTAGESQRRHWHGVLPQRGVYRARGPPRLVCGRGYS